MQLETLQSVKDETYRFLKKLNDAIDKLTIETDINGCKETGAVKRAAADLKNELTKITFKK